MKSIQYTNELEEKKNHGNKQFPFAYYYANTYDAPCVVSYHWHKETEIIYIEHGEVIITIDGSTTIGKEHEIYFINPEQLHQVIIEKEDSCYFSFVFHMDWLDFKMDDYAQTAILDPLKKELDFPMVLTPEIPCYKEITDSLFAIREYYTSHQNNYQMIIKLCLYQVLLLMNSHQLLIPGNSHGALKSSQSGIRIQELMEYISQHYQDHITLEQGAEIMHMSPKYFSSFFSKTFLVSFVQFLNNYRIDQACILLKTSNMQILEIAFAVGFDNISYFTKKFKEVRNMTPKEYRKRTAPIRSK